MDISLGHVTSVFESGSSEHKKFIIKFTIPGNIEDAIAYPINHLDEPNVGDPVIIYELESIFGYSFMYQIFSQKNHTRLKMGDSVIDIDDDGEGEKTGTIIIRSNTSSEGEADEGDGPCITLTKDKTIEIFTPKVKITLDEKGDLDFEVGKNLDITVNGNATIHSDNTLNVEGRSVNVKAEMSCTIDGGKMTKLAGSSVIPTGSGGLCAIKVCPYTGLPHVGDTVM